MTRSLDHPIQSPIADNLMSTHPKVARTDHDVLDVIRHRWSPRAFDPDREVSRADLLRLFEAARWAPSSGNRQPWRFVLVDRRRSNEPFARMVETLTGRNPDWAGAASVLVVVAVHSADGPGRVSPMACYDAGQAVGFLTLQATELGMSVRQMGGFDRDRVRSVCAVPADFDPVVVIAIGYAGDPKALGTERHRTDERQPRARQPVSALVYEEAWDRPVHLPAPDSS